ncbi:hypothetical protein TNIN_132041 [Trichonephila inaurata madagascariensis]|uniref:Uncharacterized protein n=1 Tax=Trichonephila inaurata madagascariensis TaxID=2747483 RepID=A0A8X7CJ24_9ARAC|nr:hypothetical protein TNIN_132041 [Trichonephila inaurata madagascariensis]
MRRGGRHLRHIDIQSENCKKLYTPQHLSNQRRSCIPLNSSKRNPSCYTWCDGGGEGGLALPPYLTGEAITTKRCLLKQMLSKKLASPTNWKGLGLKSWQ